MYFMLQILCETGCHKDIRNKYGVTPVYEAALKGKYVNFCTSYKNERVE